MPRKYEKHPKIRIKETGQIYSTYNKAAKAINGNRGCVYLCLRGMRGKHKGYTFEYVKE